MVLSGVQKAAIAVGALLLIFVAVCEYLMAYLKARMRPLWAVLTWCCSQVNAGVAPCRRAVHALLC
jgi:hypothetical protein